MDPMNDADVDRPEPAPQSGTARPGAVNLRKAIGSWLRYRRASPTMLTVSGLVAYLPFAISSSLMCVFGFIMQHEMATGLIKHEWESSRAGLVELWGMFTALFFIVAVPGGVLAIVGFVTRRTPLAWITLAVVVAPWLLIAASVAHTLSTEARVKELRAASEKAQTGPGKTGLNSEVLFEIKSLFGFAAFSPDGKTVATNGLDQGDHGYMTVVLWDAQTGKARRTLTDARGGEELRSVTFSPDGKLVATGGSMFPGRVWDAETGDLKWSAKAEVGGSDVGNCVAFSPDGKILATCERGRVKLWNVDTGEAIRTVMQGSMMEYEMACIRFWSDGKTLAAAGKRFRGLLWDVDTGAVKATLNWDAARRYDVETATLSADGKVAASGGSDGTIKIWDMRTGKVKRTLIGHPSDGVGMLAFSPDGRALASESRVNADGLVKVWDVETGVLDWTLTGQRDVVKSVAFSPDGTLAVTASSSPIKVWRLHAPLTVAASVAALVTQLNDRESSVRCTAAVELGNIGLPAKAAVPALIEALKDKDDAVRVRAAVALGNVGPDAKAAVPALIEALKAKNSAISPWVAEALKKIDPEAAAKTGAR